MLEIGKARKSLPMRPAAPSWSSETDDCPVGRFTPPVRMTKSDPRVKLPRSCVSVRPLISLTVPPDVTRARAYAVPTSKVKREPNGMETKTGRAISEIVSFTGALI
jgi:hypothetical protein